jgi:hypothetical protein
MSDSVGRICELDNWSVITRICVSLDTAMVLAQGFLTRTSHIVLWPVQSGQWLLIARFPVWLN